MCRRSRLPRFVKKFEGVNAAFGGLVVQESDMLVNRMKDLP
jgi:hypothetical protein